MRLSDLGLDLGHDGLDTPDAELIDATAELRRLSELKSEHVETVTSTGVFGLAPLASRKVTLRGLSGLAPNAQHADEDDERDERRRADLLARYSEAMDEHDTIDRDASGMTKPFDARQYAAKANRVGVILGEMREEGARIRKTRGSGR